MDENNLRRVPQKHTHKVIVCCMLLITHYYFIPPIIKRWYSLHTRVLSSRVDDTRVLCSHLSIIQLFEYDTSIWVRSNSANKDGIITELSTKISRTAVFASYIACILKLLSLPPATAVEVLELVQSVFETYILHHFVGTGLCCAPLTCVVHHGAQGGLIKIEPFHTWLSSSWAWAEPQV